MNVLTESALRIDSGHAVDQPDLSVLILTRNERENLRLLVPEIRKVVADLAARAEIIVVDASTDGTLEEAIALGCRGVRQNRPGYGHAFRQGLEAARGEFILTIDADHSHEPGFFYQMWALRDSADVIIGSRYVPGGRADMAWSRKLLSRVLNRIFSRVLVLPYQDLSSGYRLYRRCVARSGPPLEGKTFDVLEEILVKAYVQGWRIREVPMDYRPRHRGRSNASAIRFATSYLRTLASLWRLRNGATACDYDARAFQSWILPQRYWQRRRFKIITQLIRDHRRVLDIGCGSSQIIRSRPAMVGVDLNVSKLRFLKSTNPRLVQGGVGSLPFRDAVFSAVVCSEVIEHIPKSATLFEEMNRVLAPGGTLVLGTPDYASRTWRFIEFWYDRLMPQAYGDEHISHYTEEELRELLAKFGFKVKSVHKIVRSEVIFEAIKQ
jgi:dolichol-phosphate mannosyltransferase